MHLLLTKSRLRNLLLVFMYCAVLKSQTPIVSCDKTSRCTLQSYVMLCDNCIVLVAMVTLVNIFGGYRKSGDAY